jgi:hypothetical protein
MAGWLGVRRFSGRFDCGSSNRFSGCIDGQGVLAASVVLLFSAR